MKQRRKSSNKSQKFNHDNNIICLQFLVCFS